MFKLLLSFCCLVLSGSAFAAHIVTETRSGSTLIQRTDTYANSAGDLRMEDRAYGSSSSVSSAASAGTSNPNVEYHLSENVDDVTLFQSNGQAVVMLEGNVCRRLTADSAPPPGLGVPGMDMGKHQEQMDQAMKQAGSAMAEAMRQAKKEGMTAEQQRALESFTKPFLDAPKPRPRNTLEIVPLNSRARVGNFTADGFLVKDLDGNEKSRIWVVDTSRIAGGRDVKRAMQGMFQVYEAYLDQMGGTALMDTGLATMFRKGVLRDKYPVRIEDLESGEITDVIQASSGGPVVDYYPACEERDMFGF